MAKTKLMEKLNIALSALEGELEAGQSECGGKLQPLSKEREGQVKKRFDEVKAAAQLLRAHLDNLKRRETEPTVKDRIRNLKNVFKDQNELKRKRQDFRDRLAQMEQDLEKQRLDVNEKTKGLGAMYASIRMPRKEGFSGGSGSFES